MNNAKEALLNLKNNKRYYLFLSILYILVIVIFAFSLLIFNSVKSTEELYYYDFTDKAALVNGSFTIDELNSYKNEDYVIYGYSSENINLELKNKTTISLDINYCYNKINNALFLSQDRYNSIEKLNIVFGRDFDEEDYIYNLNSIIINESLAAKLFESNENSIGKELKLNNVEYYIVGVVNDSPSFLRMAKLNNETYNAFVLNISSEFTYTNIIFDSNKIITKDNLDIFFEIQNKTIIQSHTKDSINKDFLMNDNNFYNILIIVFTFIGIILIIVSLTIFIAIRKEEICIKRNLGASFFDLLWEFLFEFIVTFIAIFILLLLPIHLIYWIYNKYIYSCFYLNYELENCFVNIIKIFGISLLTIITTIILNLTFIFNKDISYGLKE